METTNKKLCEEFSKGNFSFCYDNFANDIEWKIVGSNTFKGKFEVIEECEKMMSEMTSSSLNNTNIIAENNFFAVEGSCKFVSEDNKISEIFYCDLYKFDNGLIAKITSYCI